VAGTRQVPIHGGLLGKARKLQAVAPNRLAVYASSGPAADNAASRDELPLWRHLREQEGFSNDKISKLQDKGKGLGARMTAGKVQHNLAPNIAALRKEGLTTADLEELFSAYPSLLYTTHDTFMGSLAVLRGLVDQLDINKLRPYDPPLTRLGVVLNQFRTSAAYLLSRGGSYITATQHFLQDELDMSTAEFAAAVFQNSGILIKDTAGAKCMVKHLLDVYNGDLETGEAALGCRHFQ
jgi:hypothetical protein